MRPYLNSYFLILISFFLSSCAHTGKGLKLSQSAYKETAEDKASSQSILSFLKSDLGSLSGEHEKAIVELKPVIEKNPENGYLYYELAEKELALNKVESALTACEKALELSPKLIQAKLLLGKIYSLQERHIEAANVYDEIIKEAPLEPEAYILLTREYIGLKKYNEAAGVANKLLIAEPDSSVAYYYLGMIYGSFLKQYDKAISAYQKILESEPSDIQIHAAIAEIYIARKQSKKALAKLLEMEALAPDDISVNLKTGLLYYDLKEYDKAAERFEKILAKNPESDKIRYYLGIIYLLSGKNEESIKNLSLIPPKSSYYKDANIQIAQVHISKEAPAEAVKVISSAIEQKVDEPLFYQFLAGIYEKTNDFVNVISTLEKGAAALPDNEALNFSLGIFYDKVKEQEKALNVMNKVIVINPKNASALNYIGYTYAERGENLDEAEDMLQEAASLKPNDGYILDSLGWLYFKKGDLTKAHELLKRAAQLVPKEPTVFEHLGDLMMKLRTDAREALIMYKKALKFSQAKKEKDEEEIKRLEGKVCEAGGC